MNKSLIDAVDRSVDAGTRKVLMSRNNYRTFVRVVYGKVYNGQHDESVLYRGVIVTTFNGENK
jgi:hypothetical protein